MLQERPLGELRSDGRLGEILERQSDGYVRPGVWEAADAGGYAIEVREHRALYGRKDRKNNRYQQHDRRPLRPEASPSSTAPVSEDHRTGCTLTGTEAGGINITG